MQNSPALPVSNGGFGAIQAATMNWVNNSQFYALVNPYYHSFYEQWVRLWLAWYDGYVPGIHDGENGMLSSKIGTTIVNRAADTILGGGIMFHNAHPPTELEKTEEGRTSKALKFITGNFSDDSRIKSAIKKSIRLALAGGSSLLKINSNDKGKLWFEAIRMDRFYATVDYLGKVTSVKSYIASYNDTMPNGTLNGAYYIVEERYFGEGDKPTIEYKLYRAAGNVSNTMLGTGTAASIPWSALPKKIAHAIKSSYGVMRFDEPRLLPFADSLGCVLMNCTDGISNLPQLQFGESLIANCMSYLYMYDYYLSSMSTDMYLGRGRVMLPKSMAKQGNGNRATGINGNYNSGLDSFMYVNVEYQTTEDKTPIPLQFALRSIEWREIRNNLLESIATSIGISVGTLASYLNDTSARTAREISAEESATTLFVEEKRRLFEAPINELLRIVTHYHGMTDQIEVRWSKSGFTNPQVLADTLSRAKQAGLISGKKAHRMYNVDDDEDQVEEDWALVQEDMQNEQNSLFGDFSLNAGDVE